MRISVVMPVLDEAAFIDTALAALAPLRARGHEVLVVDGGSRDATAARAAALADQVLASPAGRAVQMNKGAAVARGEVLWFLHADSLAPSDGDQAIEEALNRSGRRWGRFRVRLSGTPPALRMVEALMNARTCITGIVTGDHGMFVERALFREVGGFPGIPLMEDIAISRRLRRTGRPLCLRARVVTSSRRWERDGVLRTILVMWRLRLAYALGADPWRLAARYYPERRDEHP